MKLRYALTTILTLSLALAATAEQYRPARGSSIRIEGKSSLHDWKMEGSTINGQVTTPPIGEWQNGITAALVNVTIPVTSIRSEHAKMDKLMADALKSKANPDIRYQLTTATSSGSGPYQVSTKGKLTIAGVTRDVDMLVSVSRDATGAYLLTGSLPIRMSDYGIKPPTAMLGTIKTGNDVKVSFRWVVQPGTN